MTRTLAEKKRRTRKEPSTPPPAGEAGEAGDAGGTDSRLTYEEELALLEEAVDDLERGELTLDEAISRYEGACRSLRRCFALLESAKRRVEALAPPAEGEGEDSPAVWAPMRLSGFEDDPTSPGPASEEDEESAVSRDGEDRAAID